jgi:hypothetical protein
MFPAAGRSYWQALSKAPDQRRSATRKASCSTIAIRGTVSLKGFSESVRVSLRAESLAISAQNACSAASHLSLMDEVASTAAAIGGLPSTDDLEQPCGHQTTDANSEAMQLQSTANFPARTSLMASHESIKYKLFPVPSVGPKC